MSLDEKAGSQLVVEMVGHVTAIAWIRRMILGVPDAEPDPPQYDLNVKVRSSGKVVHSMRLAAGVAANAGMNEIEEDLEILSLDEFCEKYGFPVPR